MKTDNFMQIAFAEAAKGESTWTNPKVCAVIVKDGQILAKGHHEKFGGPHAEINTLSHLKNISDAKGADMYVTLEPCSHFGKTPPCVQKLVEVGISRVFIGEVDPNPIVSGRGIKYLKDHGIEVTDMDCQSEINESYNFYYQKKRPLVTLKYAMTMDGKINQKNGQRSIITGQTAYQDAQKLRSENQAILIGEHTLKVDDPQLTVRIKKMDFPLIRVVVVDSADEISTDMKIFQDTSSEIYLLSKQAATKQFPDQVHVEVGDWTPKEIVKFLAEKNIESLLVEGGSHLQADFVAAKLLDKVVVYLAPKIFGGNALPAIATDSQAQAIALTEPELTQLGSDLKVELRKAE